MTGPGLIVIRHGEAETNVDHVLSSVAPGRPLTALGVVQAEELSRSLADRGVLHVYTSPVLRALQTAGIVAERLGADLTVLADLREFGLGRREGTPGTNLDVIQHPAFDGWLEGKRLDDTFDGGESGAQIVTRMRRALTTVQSRHPGPGPVAMVSHGGSIAIALTNLCPGLDPATVRTYFPRNCAAFDVERDGDSWRCTHWPTW